MSHAGPRRRERFHYRLAYGFVRRVFLRTRVRGLGRLPPDGPAILVANHNGSYGPIAVMASLPLKLYPWVIHQVTDLKLCAEYLRKDFTEKELRLKPPWSVPVSRLLARICVALMCGIEAIPVHRQSRRIWETFQHSLRRLEEGGRLIIFPERPEEPAGADAAGKPAGGARSPMRPFDPGFVWLARMYAARFGRPIRIFPVAVSRRTRTLWIGLPVYLNAQLPLAREKVLRVRTILEKRIKQMIRTLEAGLNSRFR